MRLHEIDILRLIPQFMRNDETARAFAYALNNKLKEVTEKAQHAQIYARIDSLSEEVLDELAWQFNIVEYRHEYDISTKRELIKGCMEIHHKRGTVAAVEDVVRKIFGDATIEEWFDYGGEPYHFKIYTSNITSTDEMVQEVIRTVRDTQNVRSHLEEVIIEFETQSMDIFVGCKSVIMDAVELQTVDIN